jgi:hypothetical protein
MVRRSHSLKCDTPDRIMVPLELRDTIYDVTTPKSDRVKRNLSDRIVSSGSGRKPRRPLIKPSATTAPGVRRTIVHIGAGGHQAVRAPPPMTGERIHRY